MALNLNVPRVSVPQGGKMRLLWIAGASLLVLLVGYKHHASETLETYRPLSELTNALGLPSELAEAPPTAARERG
ncbi:MAG: hypothetical protein E6J65_28660 [Deltaproteobacteria bacterium]|nr:MAG: hypothetical protein E6J65_28660 [Deltaproteobacteria bacterium]